MTKEELAEIRERAETALNMGSIAWESADGVQMLCTTFKEDIPKLLAEVERLQRQWREHTAYGGYRSGSVWKG